MKKAVVAVPYYKTELTPIEEFALSRTISTLGGGGYDIAFITPRSIQNVVSLKYSKYDVLGCDDNFFISPQTYNRLCFSKNFYEQFSEYEYMLLCQLGRVGKLLTA